MITKIACRIALVCVCFWGVMADADDSAIYTCQENVVYAVDHGAGMILDVFVPKGTRNGLGIVHTMNGGYESHDAMREHFRKDFKIYDIFCSHGYTVFSVRPGSLTKFSIEEMTVNLKKGIRWAKAHAGQYQVDPDRLGLTGASAGGNLALLSMVYEDAGDPNSPNPLEKYSTRVAAAGIFFPPTDLLDEKGQLSAAGRERLGRFTFPCSFDHLSEEDKIARATALSPARQVKAILPPVIIYQGDIDPYVPMDQALKMVDALRKTGGQAELIIVKDHAHTWPGIDKEVGEIADWFDQKLVKK